MYQVQRTPRSEFVRIRNLQYHVLTWGTPSSDRPPLVMVHGWMDVAASYQFVVDAFSLDRFVIAPDWRGFGLTAVPGTDNYWFPDYLADLDLLLDHYAPGQAVDLVGHSMGGNIAMFYGGVRPSRIRRLVNLEGFGMPQTRPAQAPERYGKWIDELKSLHSGTMELKTYDDAAGVARRLMKTNQRLSQDKADWLATHWARPNAAGKWEILGDAAHKIINAQLFRVDEVLEIYKRITAPVLALEASDDSLGKWWAGRYTLDEYHERLRSVSDVRIGSVADAGHMLHHDQPHEVARQIEEFL
ncbi:alpha/beta fold hydrolase [Variovorax sp. VNK109]|uniref:alpha/beta fold hydrolase n=1 Tax=Variovorax sp. VNK109 TaxID=3400919 RepID=UPI003C12AADA